MRILLAMARLTRMLGFVPRIEYIRRCISECVIELGLEKTTSVTIYDLCANHLVGRL